MTELWKPIIDYESLYDVSNMGNVRRKHKRGTFNILSGNLNKKGYRRVILSKNNKPTKYLVHRLVASSFIDNSSNKPQVNHINGIKTDNRVDNLEWCTSQENFTHALDVLGWRGKLTKKGIDSYNNKTVYQFLKTGEFIQSFYNARKAQEITGVAYQGISNSCIGKKQKTAGGFIWRFIF